MPNPVDPKTGAARPAARPPAAARPPVARPPAATGGRPPQRPQQAARVATSDPRPPTAAVGSRVQARPPIVTRHADDAVASILVRDAYTRDRHIFLVRIIISLAVVILALVGVVGFLATRPPANHYFYTNAEGKLTEMVALDRAINTVPEVSNWVSNAVTQAYTFSFANYVQELNAARMAFTPSGWKGFEKALKDSGNLASVVDNKYVASAVPTGAPILVNSGLIDGRYAYKFQLPILVTYQNSVQRVTQNLMITVIVVRQPETDQPRGLGIAQLLAE